MDIMLTPWLEEFVQEKVEAGEYADVSEVIREALRLLARTEHAESSCLEEMIAEADAEPSSPMTENDWAEVRRYVKSAFRPHEPDFKKTACHSRPNQHWVPLTR